MIKQQVEAKKNVYESISHLSSIHPHTQYNLLLTVCKMIFSSLQRELQSHVRQAFLLIFFPLFHLHDFED
jgi:5-methylcytosine-specific restriction endonuclease McrBC regulatory subunit McrC